jgi:3-dehydroquinate dehydratase-1
MGGISRLVGEALGSAMTFGAAAKASAPGQIDVNKLDVVLETIHNSL